MSDVSALLESLGLGRFASRFADEEIDLDALVLLDDSDLQALGLPLGPRRKLLNATAGRRRLLESGENIEADEARGATTDSPLAGERKLLTVLFADLRGSTSLIEGLDAEAAVDRLQPAIDAMTSAVSRFGGTVNRVQGDGIMALFGAPVAREDHALRACLAALDMCHAIQSLGDPDLRPRVGVHSGETVVRLIRNDLTDEYEADGPDVHLAARMEQAAEPGTVRITHAVWRAVDGHVDVRALGALPVRGRAEPVLQYEVLGVSSAATRWEGRARRGLSQLVGRSRELAVLQQATAEALSGDGRVVALVGEAGMGKSRLLHEFLTSPAASTWTLRVVAASPHGQRTPYLPLRQLLRAALDVRAEEGARGVELRLDALLSGLGGHAPALRAPLLALLDHDPGDPGWGALEPEERRRQIVEAMRELTVARARVNPLLLVFEDLHWLDDESRRVLDRLAESVATAPVLLFTTSRPEYRIPWYGKSYFVPVHLGAISAADVEELLGHLLGQDASLRKLKAQIATCSGGRPLYIEEIVRALVDGGELTGPQGARRLPNPHAPVPIPDSVHAVIGARIDRLDPVAKRLLQVAAVIGRTVSEELLAAATSRSNEELREPLRALREGEFLFETQSYPSTEYLFKHALIEDVAYGSLLRRDRRRIHQSVFQALLGRHAGRLDEHPELLALHAFRGELWPDAIRHAHAAGKKAIASSAFAQAVAHLDQALEALEHVEDGNDRARLGVEIRMDLRPALGAVAEYARLLERLEEARTLARRLGDARREVRITADSVHVIYHLGRIDAARERAGEAVEAAERLGAEEALVLARANQSQAHYYAGMLAQALESGLPLVEALRTRHRHGRIGTTCTSSVLFLGNLAGVTAAAGQFDEAVALGAEACRIAEETELPLDRVMAGNWHALALLHRGEAEAAREYTQRSTTLVVAHELVFPSRWSMVTHAFAVAACGEPQAALAYLLQAREHYPVPPTLVTLKVWHEGFEALVHLAAADLEGAAAIARSVLDDGERLGIGLVLPVALRVRAACHVADGEFESATQALHRARAVAERQGALPEVAHIDLALGQACASAGLEDEARAAAARAGEAYRAMGMSRWLADVEALSG